MKVKTICIGRTQDAIKAVNEFEGDKILFQRGIWNNYENCSKKDAIMYINNSDYGANVYAGEDGNLYISTQLGVAAW